ncbi:MAG: hypothetical protein ACM3XS_09055 [Bacteroidota bacterium]
MNSQTMKDYTPRQRALLVAELYRAMPRQVREGKDIDQLICRNTCRRQQTLCQANQHGCREDFAARTRMK